MSNILAKMLKRGESEQPPVFIDNSTGPNGAIMIYQNPYYVNKDPLKAIFFDGNDGSGRPMIYRNPFAQNCRTVFSKNVTIFLSCYKYFNSSIYTIIFRFYSIKCLRC